MRIPMRTPIALVVLALAPAIPTRALAHCDTLDGPVVADARAALASGELDPVLKWIRESDEPEIRQAFGQALKVRALSPEAKELADRFFFETLVRVHRAGEGAPYTGLKPAGSTSPAIRAADEALASGSAEALVEAVTGAVERELRERFAQARAARERKDGSAAEGREYVERYVAFIHYVEAIHGAGHHEEHS